MLSFIVKMVEEVRSFRALYNIDVDDFVDALGGYLVNLITEAKQLKIKLLQ